MKTDLKINYAVLEDIADNVKLYKTAIEDIDDSIRELSKVIEKQKSESTKKLASKISKKKDKRSDLIKKLDEIQKMIQNYCADMRSLVNCKQEQKNTRVDQLDVQFNVWQIKTSIFSFVCDMTSEPQESNLPIQVGPNCDPHREEKEKKMQANYKKLMNFYRNRIVPTYKEIDEYTDDFKKIYDKFVAPYENKDDEYASKMEKIYDKGKSWLQKAEDWLHNHKDAIGVFFTEFVKGFVVAAVVVVIAGVLAISAGVVFTVLMIAVPLGESAVASIPDGAFDGPLLKDFKKSCNETKDSVGKLCSITLDRGPMGFVECIGQGMEDAVQTDKGIASITGSITGMIAGSFAGDNLSLKVKKVKAAKAKAKSLKISETKEPELKNVEGEKPEVSKVEEKPIGPQAKSEKVKFKEGRYEHHMVYGEKFTKKGVSGGHNWKKFDDYIGKSEYSFDSHKVIKHPDIDGVYEIEYTLKRPIKDYTGKPIPGEFKHVPGGKRIFKKTVYDPNVISDNEMIKLSKDAMKEAVKSGRCEKLVTQKKIKYKGQVLYRGKTLKFEGYKNMNTGEIENAHPVLEWSRKLNEYRKK